MNQVEFAHKIQSYAAEFTNVSFHYTASYLPNKELVNIYFIIIIYSNKIAIDLSRFGCQKRTKIKNSRQCYLHYFYSEILKLILSESYPCKENATFSCMQTAILHQWLLLSFH